MIELKTLTAFDAAAAQPLIKGYTTDSCFQVVYSHTPQEVKLELHLQPLNPPVRKTYDPMDETTIERYTQVIQAGLSVGAFEGSTMVGIALSEHQQWNNTLWVWEFHVAESWRGRGVGRQMMEALIKRSTNARIRAIVCETQNTNAPAIRFYQRMGFRVEGIDISYYSNDDYPNGEVAIFMKRRLP